MINKNGIMIENRF